MTPQRCLEFEYKSLKQPERDQEQCRACAASLVPTIEGESKSRPGFTLQVRPDCANVIVHEGAIEMQKYPLPMLAG